MPGIDIDRAFFETYPLYRRLDVAGLSTLDQVQMPSIKLPCRICQSDQTFNFQGAPWAGFRVSNQPVAGVVIRTQYLCMGCGRFERYFLLKFGEDGRWIVKAGQWPAWEITTNQPIERMLGAHAGLYKKGLVCESQGYGIGAFSYYRRIVEETIDTLLADIAEMLSGEELARYEEAFTKVGATRVTEEKIDLVKDLLPASLRPEGMNPLKLLHGTLSEGLHAESDDKCLEYAAAIREVLLFLVGQIELAKASAKTFTEGMRRLLEKRSGAG